MSRAADQVAENLNDTRGLKQVLKTERSLADRAAQKYQRLMVRMTSRINNLQVDCTIFIIIRVDYCVPDCLIVLADWCNFH